MDAGDLNSDSTVSSLLTTRPMNILTIVPIPFIFLKQNHDNILVLPSPGESNHMSALTCMF